MREQLIKVYLDWVNNWLTVSAFAQHYQLTVPQATQLIELGKSIHGPLEDDDIVDDLHFHPSNFVPQS